MKLYRAPFSTNVERVALALAAVVVFDPWAPLAPGLWLSFGAVMLIFYVASGWTSAGTFLAQWSRIQWAITVGLANWNRAGRLVIPEVPDMSAVEVEDVMPRCGFRAGLPRAGPDEDRGAPFSAR